MSLKEVSLKSIRTNPVALREVQKDAEPYQNLVADIGRRGILNPISVMEKVDEASGETYYQIVDGLHRYSASCDNDLEVIPVHVLSITDAEVVETQIVANLVKVDTKPVEYTKALQRMFSVNPTLTVPELAEKISASPTFIMQRLSLLKLEDSVQKLVDSGEIKLSNAFALSKLPKENQLEWVDLAISQAPTEFVPAVNTRVKELAAAARAGKEAAPEQYTHTARLRKLVELRSEFDNPAAGPALCAQVGVSTAAEGFALGIAYAISMDVNSVAAGQAKYDAQKKASAEEKKKNAAIREAKKQKDAAEKAAKAKAESGMSDDEIAQAVSAREAELAAKAAEKAEAGEPAVA